MLSSFGFKPFLPGFETFRELFARDRRGARFKPFLPGFETAYLDQVRTRWLEFKPFLPGFETLNVG